MTRYLIIGSGASGIAAAEAIRSKDHSGEILMLTNDPHGYYSRPGLAYLLTGELPEELLYPVHEDYFNRLRIRRKLGRALRVETQSHRVLLENNAPIP